MKYGCLKQKMNQIEFIVCLTVSWIGMILFCLVFDCFVSTPPCLVHSLRTEAVHNFLFSTKTLQMPKKERIIAFIRIQISLHEIETKSK